MVKYIIEGGIDFYEELYKSLDEPDNNNDIETCQITGLPLEERFVTMECNHKFNYVALYTEIYKQKFVFQTYKFSSLTDSDQIKFKDAKKDYFIKCPYCRSIQFTLLPYYDDSALDKRYGINSLEKTNNDTQFIINPNIGNYSYTSYGYTFTNGNCCKVLGNVDGKDIMCTSKMSSHVTEMNKSFCSTHIRVAVKEYKLEKKQKEKADIKKQKEDEKELLKTQKEEAKETLKKQKEEAKELQKKQKNIKKVKNVVTAQTIEIQTFQPESNATESNENASTNESNACQTVLKSGPRKGQTCGNKALKNGSTCSRHKELVLEEGNNNI
jgi:DNA repair exonuclease SbcCD nuclease subunit